MRSEKTVTWVDIGTLIVSVIALAVSVGVVVFGTLPFQEFKKEHMIDERVYRRLDVLGRAVQDAQRMEQNETFEAEDKESIQRAKEYQRKAREAYDDEDYERAEFYIEEAYEHLPRDILQSIPPALLKFVPLGIWPSIPSEYWVEIPLNSWQDIPQEYWKDVPLEFWQRIPLESWRELIPQEHWHDIPLP